MILRLSKQWDCKSKWYYLTLEQGDKILREFEVNINTKTYGRKLKDLWKKKIEVICRKYKNENIKIIDETEDNWKYVRATQYIDENEQKLRDWWQKYYWEKSEQNRVNSKKKEPLIWRCPEIIDTKELNNGN